jgi:hypothetical protein
MSGIYQTHRTVRLGFWQTPKAMANCSAFHFPHLAYISHSLHRHRLLPGPRLLSDHGSHPNQKFLVRLWLTKFEAREPQFQVTQEVVFEFEPRGSRRTWNSAGERRRQRLWRHSWVSDSRSAPTEADGMHAPDVHRTAVVLEFSCSEWICR